MKPLLQVLKLYSTIRKLDFNFQYEAATLLEVFINIIDTLSERETSEFEKGCKEFDEGQQAGIKGMVDMFASQAGMFLEPFKPAINAIDFDNISLYATCPNVKVFVKGTIQFRGVSDFIGKTFA